MAEEELKYPFPLCLENVEKLGALREGVESVKETMNNHFSSLEEKLELLTTKVENNGVTGRQKAAFYTAAFGAIVAIVELLIRYVL